MNAILRKEILTETYKDMQGLVTSAAYKFWSIYGGDLDDLNAQANLIFIYAVDDYDQDKSKIANWLTFKIEKGLLNYMREQYRLTHTKYRLTHSEIAEKIKLSRQHFSVIEFVDEMERDAQTILQLFLDTPQEIIQSTLERKKRYDHLQGHMRKRLRNRLRQMDWTIRRITEAFEEIKTIISY